MLYQHKLSLANHRIKDIAPLIDSIIKHVNIYYSIKRKSQLRLLYYNNLSDFIKQYTLLNKKYQSPKIKKVKINYPKENIKHVPYYQLNIIKQNLHTISMYLQEYHNVYENKDVIDLQLYYHQLYQSHLKLLNKEAKNL